MPRRIAKKCQYCATLTVEEALALHGTAGDNCWNAQICHRRRSHYRKRDDINSARRRLRRVGNSLPEKITAESVEVKPPTPQSVSAAVLVLYRQRPEAPVHAVAAEVWQGNHKMAEVKAVHCMGMRADRVTAYIKDLLKMLHEQFGITRFEDVVKERPVEQCPIEQCPFKP